MNHHQHGSQCPACDEKLLQGHPSLKAAHSVIKKEFPDCHISWVWRGKEDQDLFFIQKKTNEVWPNGKHNHMINGVPCSLAMDLFKLNENNESLFLITYFEEIASFIEKADLPLDWSGSWHSFVEKDHFQLKGGAYEH